MGISYARTSESELIRSIVIERLHMHFFFFPRKIQALYDRTINEEEINKEGKKNMDIRD